MGLKNRVLHSRKGFSRIELIIALLVVSAVIAIFLPRYIRAAKQSSAEVCRINRATIIRQYTAHRLTHAGCTLRDVLTGVCISFEDDTSAYSCPQGGLYSANEDGDRIYCTKHGW